MKTILKKAMVLAAVGILTITTVACSSKKEITEESNKVVMGLDNTFVPMGFLGEDGKMEGFDVDLAKEAFKRIGKDVEFKNVDWSMKETELKNKNVDLLWNGYTITPEREKQVAFSDPYLENKQIVVVMDNSGIKTIDELKDKKVATQSGSTSMDALEKDKRFADKVKNSEIATYDTFDKALRDLEIGRVNAVVGDEVLLKYYIKQKGDDSKNYKVLDGDLGTEQYGIGFRKEDTKLKDDVNKALKDMQDDGTYDKIKAKWFN